MSHLCPDTGSSKKRIHGCEVKIVPTSKVRLLSIFLGDTLLTFQAGNLYPLKAGVSCVREKPTAGQGQW